MKTFGRTIVSAGLLVVAAGAASAANTWTSMADQDAKRQEVRVRRDAEPQTSTLQVNRDDATYEIRLKDGKVVSAKIDGKDVPPDRIIMDDSAIRLLGEDGTTLFESARAKGGGLAYGARAAPAQDREAALAKRPMIGVTLSEVSEALAGQLGIDSEQAVVISGLSEGMPAAKAGLKKFDVVVKIDGKPGASADALGVAVRSKKVGDTIALGLLREGKPVEVTITVGEGSPANVFEFDDDDAEALRWMGEAGGAQALAERLSREAREQAVRGQQLGEQYRVFAQELGDRTRLHLKMGGERAQELLEELHEAWGEIKDSVARDGAAKVSELLEQLHNELEQAGDHMMRVMPRVEFFEGGQNGGPRALVVPSPPAPPAAPAAPRAPRGEMRWTPDDGGRSKALEERIESLEARIDALLKKMEEKSGGR